MQTTRVSLAAFAFLLSTLVLSGCGGGATGDTVVAGAGKDFQLNQNVIELQDNQVTVLGVDPSSVTLKGTTNSLSPGQILIHNAMGDKRFLRTVNAVSIEGGNTVIATSDATLEDVFDTASIGKSEIIPATAFAGLQPANSAIKIGAPILATVSGAGGPQLLSGSARGNSGQLEQLTAAAGNPQYVLPINIADWSLKDDNGTTLAMVNGAIQIAVGVETRLQKSGPRVSEFRVAPFVNVTGDLDIKGNYTGDFHNQYPITLPLSFPTPVGIGPLGVNGNLTLTLEVDGHVDAQGKLHARGTVNAKAGVQYVDGTWSGVSDFSTGLALTSADVRVASRFAVSLLRPQLGLDVLGVGEVHVTSDVIRGEVEIVYQTSPTPGFLISHYGDFQLQVGGSIKLGPVTLWSSSISADLGRFLSGSPLLLADLQPTDSRIVYVTPDLRQLRVMYADGSGDSLVYSDTNALFAPSMDPTGQAVAFGRINSSSAGNVCTVRLDGTALNCFTDNAYSINHPNWGPNGLIAFDAGDTANVKQIFILNPSTHAVTQITNDQRNSRHPYWSPDGQYLLYEFQATGTNYMIARTDPNVPGSFTTIYTDDTLSLLDPSYSANGRQIIFRDGSYFYVTSDSGSLSYKIPMGSVLFKHPVFSPDGNQIAADANPVGPPSIRVFNNDGTGQRSLATGTYASWKKTQ
jgi:hypothetical protein